MDKITPINFPRQMLNLHNILKDNATQEYMQFSVFLRVLLAKWPDMSLPTFLAWYLFVSITKSTYQVDVRGTKSWDLGTNTVTPNYKDKKIETEKTKTYNTPFLSLKRPDFKYVIFKIVEVSPRNPPAKQHSRFGPIPPNVGRIGCAA